MTVIPVDLNDVKEPSIAPAGRYNLQVLECKLGETGPNSKNPGTPMFTISVGFPDDIDYVPLRHFIVLPSQGDDAKTMKNKSLGLKRFLQAFRIPFSSNGIDTEELQLSMIGATANLEVSQSEPNAEGNIYNNLKLPRAE